MLAVFLVSSAGKVNSLLNVKETIACQSLFLIQRKIPSPIWNGLYNHLLLRLLYQSVDLFRNPMHHPFIELILLMETDVKFHFILGKENMESFKRSVRCRNNFDFPNKHNKTALYGMFNRFVWSKDTEWVANQWWWVRWMVHINTEQIYCLSSKGWFLNIIF